MCVVCGVVKKKGGGGVLVKLIVKKICVCKKY